MQFLSPHQFIGLAIHRSSSLKKEKAVIGKEFENETNQVLIIAFQTNQALITAYYTKFFFLGVVLQCLFPPYFHKIYFSYYHMCILIAIYIKFLRLFLFAYSSMNYDVEKENKVITIFEKIVSML